jgi:enoyl-CoA hydratase/carnithine racemase
MLIGEGRRSAMSLASNSLRFLKVATDADGVTVVTFDRPPVNAFSTDVYRDFIDLVDVLEADAATRVVVLTSPDGARAWGGGADLNDFLALDYERRLARYALVNQCLERFYNLKRAVVAAVNNHAVGVGLVLATLCDIRVASRDAFFSLPEIDRGVLANGGGMFFRLNMPQGVIREMIYTGRRFMAEELVHAGVFNYIVDKRDVLPKALEVARLIAKKSLPAIEANKAAINLGERQTYWLDTYRATQRTSAQLTVGDDAKEGVRAFLEKRDPVYRDR